MTQRGTLDNYRAILEDRVKDRLELTHVLVVQVHLLRLEPAVA